MIPTKYITKALIVLKKYQKLLMCVPPFLLAVLLLRFSVATPFWDQWEIVPIVRHLHEGHFYWNDIWLQHNEHRLLFPKIIMIVLAYLTHWNTIFEVLFGLGTAIGSFILLLKLVGRTTRHLPEVKGFIPLLLPVLLSAVWFSTVQAENWMWGWQIQWFMNVLGVVLVSLGLSKVAEDKLSWKGYFFAMLGAVFAQYSLGNGTLLWPLMLAALVYYRVGIRRLLAVVIVAGISTRLYYLRYSNISSGSQDYAIHHPLQLLHYMATYLGRPVSYMHRITPLCGLVILGLYIALSGYLYLYQRQTFRRMVPWMALGAYAIASATITAMARLSFGLEQAYSSRYTTISSLLLVCVIMLAFSVFSLHQKRLSKACPCSLRVALLVFVALLTLNYGWGIRNVRERGDNLRAVKSCTRQPTPPDSCLLTTYPNARVVDGRLEYLKSIHWGGY